ncbi:MAG: DNA repair protein RadC [Pseudohongiellaceae bacterium]|jgi:DNA repair protein RadC
MNITSWPVIERPKEKLLAQGVARLSDAELLALILLSGASGINVVDLARQLLNQFGGLRGLLSASKTEICQINGLGDAKYSRLCAVKELGDRYRLEEIPRGDVFNGTAATKDYLRAKYLNLDIEVFSGLFLDSQHQLIKIEELFVGTIDGAAVYPREVVKKCLHLGAAAVIFAHNHPSGVAEPSHADIAITSKLKAALQTVDIRVLDHLIIGDPNITSMAERGLI